MVVLVLAPAIAGVSLGGVASQEQDPTDQSAVKFVAPGQTLNLPKTVPTLSRDGAVVTHLFQDLFVEVGGAIVPGAGTKRALPEAAAASASVFSVLAEHEKPVYVRQILTGQVILDPGVEAAVLFQSCGKTTLVPVQKSEDGEFRAEVVGTVEAEADYVATISILVQRGSREREVKGFVVVDSLELTITDSPESKQ